MFQVVGKVIIVLQFMNSLWYKKKVCKRKVKIAMYKISKYILHRK